MNTFWEGKKVLITGHTGFKGSWLSLWLNKLGADVYGYALNPITNPSIFEVINLNNKVKSEIADVRDGEKLYNIIKKYKPEIIFHLAAQPVVLRAYADPVETLQTNILGTANLLDAVRRNECVKVVVSITSDKCYENKEWEWGYRETDSLGGHDPYSCSKGCAELVARSYRESYFRKTGIQLATTRAGNVIGGGDWSQDRLIPDIVKTLSTNSIPVLRSPNATRPWQHVLEPLSGYILLAEKLWSEGEKYAEPWNFGPNDDHAITVSQIANKMINTWGINQQNNYNIDSSKGHHENQLLKLDSSKAKQKLGWFPRLNIDETVEWTISWYKGFYNNENMERVTLNQIENYENIKTSY